MRLGKAVGKTTLQASASLFRQVSTVVDLPITLWNNHCSLSPSADTECILLSKFCFALEEASKRNSPSTPVLLIAFQVQCTPPDHNFLQLYQVGFAMRNDNVSF